MREWCSCGAAIRGRRNDVLNWRTDHNHPAPETDPGPQKQGASSLVEYAWQPAAVDAHIGFTPNA